MKLRKSISIFVAYLNLLSVLLLLQSVKSLPVANPQLQFPAQSSYSSQQFTMYKPVQLGYGSIQEGLRQRQDFQGNPLQPVFHYNYNVTHQPRSFLGQFQQQAPGTGGVSLDPHQLQYLRQQRRGLQQGQPLKSLYQRQYQQNQNYAPVIIANPNLINRQPTNNFQQQQQQQQQNLGFGRRSNANAQFFVENSDSYTEPENEGIGFRLGSRSRSGKSRNNNNDGKIIFDPSVSVQQKQSFQFPDNILFSNQQQQQQQQFFRSRQQPQSIQLPYLTPATTTRPPIQVPYLTTPSTLKKLQQLQKNSQQTVAGFRSSHGLINPASLQSTSLTDLNRYSSLNLSPAIRSARVQNIVVPVTNAVGQTPAGIRLLQQNLNGLQNLQNSVAGTVYAHQNQGVQIPISSLHSSQTGNTFLDLSNPNLHILKGIAITPENQRDVGHIIFSDPFNPSISSGFRSGNNAVFASTAQKVFVLPQDDTLSSTDSENSINFEETPAEIIITVVDEDHSDNSSLTGERGKVLSNFSLFLLPSSYKKCVEGFKRAHDGKCRLIIKLRGKSRVYSSS